MTHSFLLVIAHILYYFTNNSLVLMSLLLVVDLFKNPIFNLTTKMKKKDNDLNISPSSEKQFMEDKRFLIPLYSIIILETISWMWTLVVCSDVI